MTRILVLAVILLLAGIASGGTSHVHGADGLIAKINETGVYYYHSDHLGSTSAMTDSEGDVVEKQVNLPFGQQISGSEKYGFTGKELDSDLNLQYFGARYYNPATGTFLTTDPALHGFSPYPYADNNPLKYVDPDGMEPRPRNYDKFDEIDKRYKQKVGFSRGAYTIIIKTLEEKIKAPEIIELIGNLDHDLYLLYDVRAEKRLITTWKGGKFPKDLVKLGFPKIAEVTTIHVFRNAFRSPEETAISIAHEYYHGMLYALGSGKGAEIGSHGLEVYLSKIVYGKLDNPVARYACSAFMAYILDAKMKGGDVNILFNDPNEIFEPYEKERLLELSKRFSISYKEVGKHKIPIIKADSDATVTEVLDILYTVGGNARNAIIEFNKMCKEKVKK